MKIGLLSDTHGFLMPAVFTFFADCDELWHCGDIGNETVLRQLEDFRPVRAVYGNIDGREIRYRCPESLSFTVEGLHVCMKHIGGHPQHYDSKALQLIRQECPQLFVCGHSHILRVMPDQQHQLLYMNPGAAGYHGFHTFSTLLRFDIRNGHPDNLEVFQIPRNETLKATDGGIRQN